MSVKENLDKLHSKIADTAKLWNKAVSDINLIAVSKMQPPERITQALEAGQRCFGENRVQEAKARWTPLLLTYSDIKLHLIGPLQTNKVKDAVKLFDMIHTLDRESLALELAKEMKKQNRNLSCLIQINTGFEPQKSGIAPQNLPQFLTFCRNSSLDIQGLMCIPPALDPPALHFALLQKLAKENQLYHLSMGMSDDFEKAIPLGATFIRVGSAIFGQRCTSSVEI